MLVGESWGEIRGCQINVVSASVFLVDSVSFGLACEEMVVSEAVGSVYYAGFGEYGLDVFVHLEHRFSDWGSVFFKFFWEFDYGDVAY